MPHIEVELNNAEKGEMGSKSRGAFLTWNDLWVTVNTKKSGSKSILKGLTGYARPSELLAVMGPSGCGKSTLLDALAGKYIILENDAYYNIAMATTICS